MKTSNKLLIAFAATLILLPILVMAVISRVYYAEGKDTDNNVRFGTQAFDVNIKDMTAIRIPSPYQRVNVNGGKQQLQLVIKIIRDEKYGVKIPDAFKDLITVKLDAQGELQINLNNIKDKQNSYANIWIYAPNISKLSLTNATYANLSAASDSLNFVVSNTGSAWIDGDLNVGKLLVTAENVGGLGIKEGDGNVKSAVLALKNTGFKSDMNSFESLLINASGESNIELIGDQDSDNKRVIKNLIINTLGKSEVKLSNILVEQCSGRFSDSTKVEMPAVNINQMYNQKK